MKISYVSYLKPQVNKTGINTSRKSFSSIDSKDSQEVADSYSIESSEFTLSRGNSKLPNSDKSSLAPSKKSSIVPSEKSSLVSSEKSSLVPSKKSSVVSSQKNSAVPSDKSSSSSSEDEQSEETNIDLKLRRLGVKLIDPHFNRRPSGLNALQGLRGFIRNSTMIGAQTIQEVQSVYEESIKDKQEDTGNEETEKLDSILKEVYDGEMEKVRSRKGYSVTSRAARPRGSAIYEKGELDRSLTQLNVSSEKSDSVATLRHQFSADAVMKGSEDDEDRSMTNSIKAIIANKHKQRRLARGGDFFILQEEKRKLTEQLVEIQSKNQMLEFEIDQLRMEANTDLETRMDKEVKRYLNELEVILKEKKELDLELKTKLNELEKSQRLIQNLEIGQPQWARDEETLKNLKAQFQELDRLAKGDESMKSSRLQKKINSIKQDNQSLKRSLADLTQSKEILAEKVKSFKAFKEKIIKEIEEINTQIQDIQATLQQTEAENEELKNVLEHNTMIIHETHLEKQAILQNCRSISSEINSRLYHKENSPSKTRPNLPTTKQSLLEVRKTLENKLLMSYKQVF